MIGREGPWEKRICKVSKVQKRGSSVVLHKHATQSHCKIGAQVSYIICVVDTGRGAAAEEELHGLHARAIYSTCGDHQHSLPILHDKGREGEILLVGDRPTP
jgi:hypothetical protein